MNTVGNTAKHCEHLLYAWEGLRTLKATVKRRFTGKACEAASAAQVAQMFKNWVLAEYKRIEGAKSAGLSEGD